MMKNTYLAGIAMFLLSLGAEAKIKKEKSADCRWTVGRIVKLQKTIERGGKGSESKFCDEYKKRVKEMVAKKCANRTEQSLRRTC